MFGPLLCGMNELKTMTAPAFVTTGSHFIELTTSSVIDPSAGFIGNVPFSCCSRTTSRQPFSTVIGSAAIIMVMCNI